MAVSMWRLPGDHLVCVETITWPGFWESSLAHGHGANIVVWASLSVLSFEQLLGPQTKCPSMPCRHGWNKGITNSDLEKESQSVDHVSCPRPTSSWFLTVIIIVKPGIIIKLGWFASIYPPCPLWGLFGIATYPLLDLSWDCQVARYLWQVSQADLSPVAPVRSATPQLPGH